MTVDVHAGWWRWLLFVLVAAVAWAGAPRAAAQPSLPPDAGISGQGASAPAAPPRTEEQQDPDAAWTSPYPQPDAGYVTDVAGLLSLQEEEQIEQRLWQVESRTGVEVAVVIIRSMADYPGTDNGSVESFARGLFDTYGIGNLPANDGVLLLVALDDRKARIELGGGYGRARDRDAERIMQGTIIRRFKNNDYTGGVTQGTYAITHEFAGVRFGINWPLIAGVVMVPVLGLIAFSLFKSGKRGWGWVVVGLLIILILAILRATVLAIKHMPRDSGGSGGWSSGGFGGGFGGGSSGGGGASGSW